MSEVMPFDIDAEYTVLASFLASDQYRRQMVAELGSDAFEGSGLSSLWDLAVELHHRGDEIDPSLVRQEVRRRKLAITDDTLARVMEMHVSDARASLEVVKALRRRRWGYRLLVSSAEAILNPDANPLEIADGVAGKLSEMVRRASRRTDRDGGAAQLSARLEDMISGRIANLPWPDAPALTRGARSLESGSITMISGSPGDGKTFLLLQSMIGWIEQGVRASICMLEKPKTWHLNRCLALLAKEPGLLRSEWVQQNPTVARETAERWGGHLEKIGTCISEGRQVGDTIDAIGRWIDAEADENDIVVVDPISLADAGEKRWIADRNFINRCIRTCERTNTRIVLVTHPNTSRGGPVSLSSLMGGTTYQRATDSVLHVTKLETPKSFGVLRYGDPAETIVTANRTVAVFKGRNGSAGGKRFAFNFDAKSLAFTEQGVILREPEAA